MIFLDAHNHLQDERLSKRLDAVIATARQAGVQRVVLNGTGEHDWPRVAALARRFPDWVLPAFGLHPWQVGKQSNTWLETLRHWLKEFPTAPLGEAGLDRWQNDYDAPAQAAILQAQLELACELQRPVVLHCLKAFGALETILRMTPPPRGFLLHSYGGSLEHMKIFAGLGGWFSCPGYFFHERKADQRAVFQAVPLERLLVETDAPDMPGPATCQREALADDTGAVLNHPANLPTIYAAVADLRKIPLEKFAAVMADNFSRFFGM